MKPRLHVSRTAIGLIKAFEGYRRSAAQLADGRWTIGYGHTLTARDGASVNESDAEALLIYDLLNVSGGVNDLTYTPLNQNQFDALTAFAFNIGLDAFRVSNVLKLVNEGALLQAAHALEAWRKADFEGEDIVVDALIRRRSAEKALFLTPQAGFVPVPSAIVKPRLDDEAVFAQPVVLTTSMQGPQAQAVRETAEPVDEPQHDLPMELVRDAAPDPVEAPAAEAVVEAVSPAHQGEILYQIPGYGVDQQFEPSQRSLASLSVIQLGMIGAGGLVLLGLSYVLALQGAGATGGSKIATYGLGAVAGLGGASGIFILIYQILNRLEREG